MGRFPAAVSHVLHLAISFRCSKIDDYGQPDAIGKAEPFAVVEGDSAAKARPSLRSGLQSMLLDVFLTCPDCHWCGNIGSGFGFT